MIPHKVVKMGKQMGKRRKKKNVSATIEWLGLCNKPMMDIDECTVCEMLQDCIDLYMEEQDDIDDKMFEAVVPGINDVKKNLGGKGVVQSEYWSDGTKVVSYKSLCEHRGNPISVGDYTIYAGGTRYLDFVDISKMDILIPLGEDVPMQNVFTGEELSTTIWGCPWKDMSVPPVLFLDLLKFQVIPALNDGKKILVYCIGSHGRTGTFIGSLIALLEPNTEDIIKAVRDRHCTKAVETLGQAKYIYEIIEKELPEEYVEEFDKKVGQGALWGGYYGRGANGEWEYIDKKGVYNGWTPQKKLLTPPDDVIKDLNEFDDCVNECWEPGCPQKPCFTRDCFYGPSTNGIVKKPIDPLDDYPTIL